ncbi:hypothetical protein N9L68_01215 [bacterium]|nr:hypothetical protein [bacterium]
MTGAYRELLTHFHPLHERSRLASDTEYTYMTTLSPEENELRRGLEIFSEWSKWILTERGKPDELERAIGEVLIPPYGMFPCCVQLQAQWVEYEDVLAPALGERYVRNHVMVRDPGPNDRFVEWPASEEWFPCHRVFADDIVKVTGDALFPWTLPNVNIIPSRAYFRQKRMGPAQEPLAAKEAMPPLGEGLSITDDGLFLMCAWGLAVNRWVTHVFNFVYREYSAVSQSDMYLIKDYYALRIAVLQRLAKWENVVATMKKYPKGSYGTANLFLRTGGLPPQRIGPADQARWRKMEREGEARKMERESFKKGIVPTPENENDKVEKVEMNEIELMMAVSVHREAISGSKSGVLPLSEHYLDHPFEVRLVDWFVYFGLKWSSAAFHQRFTMEEMMFDYPDEVVLQSAEHIPQTMFYRGLFSNLRDSVRRQLAVHDDDGLTGLQRQIHMRSSEVEVKAPPVPLSAERARQMAKAPWPPIFVKPPPAKLRGRASSAPATNTCAPPQDGPSSAGKAGDKREREPSADDPSSDGSNQRSTKRNAGNGNDRDRDNGRGRDDEGRDDGTRKENGHDGNTIIVNQKCAICGFVDKDIDLTTCPFCGRVLCIEPRNDVATHWAILKGFKGSEGRCCYESECMARRDLLRRPRQEVREEKKQQHANASQADNELMEEARRVEEEARQELALVESQNVAVRMTQDGENPTTKLKDHDILTCQCPQCSYVKEQQSNEYRSEPVPADGGMYRGHGLHPPPTRRGAPSGASSSSDRESVPPIAPPNVPLPPSDRPPAPVTVPERIGLEGKRSTASLHGAKDPKRVTPKFCQVGRSCSDPLCNAPFCPYGQDGASELHVGLSSSFFPTPYTPESGADSGDLERQMRVAIASKSADGIDRELGMMSAIMHGIDKFEISHEDMVEKNVLALLQIIHERFCNMKRRDGSLRSKEECTILCYMWMIAILASELHVVCQCLNTLTSSAVVWGNLTTVLCGQEFDAGAGLPVSLNRLRSELMKIKKALVTLTSHASPFTEVMLRARRSCGDDAFYVTSDENDSSEYVKTAAEAICRMEEYFMQNERILRSNAEMGNIPLERRKISINDVGCEMYRAITPMAQLTRKKRGSAILQFGSPVGYHPCLLDRSTPTPDEIARQLGTIDEFAPREAPSMSDVDLRRLFPSIPQQALIFRPDFEVRPGNALQCH